MKTAAAIAFLLSSAGASPMGASSIDRSHIHMEPAVVPHNEKSSSWSPALFADKNTAIKQVTVALKVDDEARAKLESIFWEVSDPDHANYGQSYSA